MWERVKADMMRAHGLKKQSDELEKQLVHMKVRIGGDWKSRFNTSCGLVLRFVGSLVHIVRLMSSFSFVQPSQAIPFNNLFYLSVELLFGLEIGLCSAGSVAAYIPS